MTAIAAVLALSDVEGWGLLWWPLWILVWCALGAAALWLLGRRRDRRDDPRYRAQEILAERFARDELTAEQYRERLAELERSDRAPDQTL